MPDDLVIRARNELDYVLLRLRGHLTLRSVPRVREATVKSLLDTGRVLIDLSGLRTPHSAMVTVFPTALSLAGGWPSARLVLFGANAAVRLMLTCARIPDTVPLANDLPAARALLQQRPAHIRRHRDLPRHPAAPAAARLFIRDTCALWSVPPAVEESAELVTSELVTNTIQHTPRSSRVTLTSAESVLRISVRDYWPTPIPRPRPIDIDAPSGRGLHLVATVAHAWGADRHPDGKTIWAHIVYPSESEKPGP